MAESTNMSRMLSERAVWQDRANAAGSRLERVVRDVLAEYLASEPRYSIDVKPADLKRLYQGRWGAVPDLAMRNNARGTTVWVEIKQQGAAGNAHERACKYFAPGLVRRAENLANVERPFYFIFAGGIVDTPGKSDKYHAEIETWFDAPGWEDHVLKWVDHDPIALCEWFERSLRPALG